MKQSLLCQIHPSEIVYQIDIISHALDNANSWIKSIQKYGSKFAIITNDSLLDKYAVPLQKTCLDFGLDTFVFSFPSGDQYKTRETLQQLEDQLFENQFGKDSCIIALGGGTVLDLSGFLASIYCRGVSLIMIPTTLLGMVDACIGGKNGLNTSIGKNTIGSIYQPKWVLIDPTCLYSLPKQEIKNGMVEMIKHGLIKDAAYFDFLVKNYNAFVNLNSEIVEKAIFESCRIKMQVVQEDEKEQGKRHVLNFGHTVGHALEYMTHYQISHGQAVAVGIIVESFLAQNLGYLKQDEFLKIKECLTHFVPKLQKIDVQKILEAMSRDKKAKDHKPRFVLIDAIGGVIPFGSNYCTTVDDISLNNALHWMNDALCSH